MKLRRPLSQSHGEPMVPLIDVVCFLLVFALLIGRRDATTPVDVAPPVSLAGVDLPGGGATLAIGPLGQLALDGEGIEVQAAVALLGDRLSADPSLRIRLQADQATPLRHVLPLLDDISAAGARDVVLVVTPEVPQ